MGAFYQSVHVVAEAAQVKQVLEPRCSSKSAKVWVGPQIGRWTTFFPDEMSGPALAQAVSADLKTPVLLMMVHDSDVFLNVLFANGKVMEQFASPADALGGEDAGPLTAPRHMLDLANSPEAARALRDLLASEAPDLAEHRMAEVMRVLGIENGLSSYEYLESGERETVSRWSEFVHLPDRTAEKARLKAIKDARIAKKKALRDDGILLFDSEFMRKPKLPSKHMLRMFASPAGNPAFFLGGLNGSPNVQRWTPPAEPAEIGGDFDGAVFSGFIETSTQHVLAADHEAIRLIDLATGRRIMTITSVHGEVLAYDPRTDIAYAHTQTTLMAFRVAADEIVFSVSVGQDIRHAVLHPTEPHLVWHDNYFVGVIHALTGERLTALQCYNSALREKKRAQWIAATGRVPSEDANVLEREDWFDLTFDPTGELAFAGTAEGLREYRYADLVAAQRQLPVPTGGVETSKVLQDYRYVYSVFVEPSRSRVLFTNGEDAIHWYDWNERTTGVLKPGGEGRKIWSMHLTGDRSRLLCRLGPGSDDLLKRQNDHWVQVWDYAKLWHAQVV